MMLEVLDAETQQILTVEVTASRVGDRRSISVISSDRSIEIMTESTNDFEEALERVRSSLEAKDLLLLCNRFRREAFVSSMSRQMTDGLGCYLVASGVPVEPSSIVECLGPAPRESVVFRREAEKHILRWVRSTRTPWALLRTYRGKRHRR